LRSARRRGGGALRSARRRGGATARRAGGSRWRARRRCRRPAAAGARLRAATRGRSGPGARARTRLGAARGCSRPSACPTGARLAAPCERRRTSTLTGPAKITPARLRTARIAALRLVPAEAARARGVAPASARAPRRRSAGCTVVCLELGAGQIGKAGIGAAQGLRHFLPKQMPGSHRDSADEHEEDDKFDGGHAPRAPPPSPAAVTWTRGMARHCVALRRAHRSRRAAGC